MPMGDRALRAWMLPSLFVFALSLATREAPPQGLTATAGDFRADVSNEDGRVTATWPGGEVVLQGSFLHGEGWATPGPAAEGGGLSSIHPRNRGTEVGAGPGVRDGQQGAQQTGCPVPSPCRGRHRLADSQRGIAGECPGPCLHPRHPAWLHLRGDLSELGFPPAGRPARARTSSRHDRGATERRGGRPSQRGAGGSPGNPRAASRPRERRGSRGSC